MPHSVTPHKTLEVSFGKHVGYKAHTPVFIDGLAVKSDYARAFLSPVLLGIKAEIGQTGSIVMVINAENTAFVLNHKPYFFSFLRKCAMRLSMTDGLGYASRASSNCFRASQPAQILVRVAVQYLL